MKVFRVELKVAFIFGMIHITVIVPGVLGLVSMSMHDGLYGLVVFVLESPIWLLIKVVGIKSYQIPMWIVAFVMTLFYSIVGFLTTKVFLSLHRSIRKKSI